MVLSLRRNGFILLLSLLTLSVVGQLKNKPALQEDFMDMGLGIFVHWSLDSQLGSVISHSLVGASENYVNKYFNALPKTFYPNKFDAFKTGPLVQYVHSLDPNIVVTRGEMKTPEQRIPNGAMPGPWETCMTMGTQWQYKPTNESYKSGTDVINKLIEIRAKGGNFLLNVGPKPNGEIAIEQEVRLRELGLWMFVNEEAIKGVRPMSGIVKDGDLWFTQNKKEKAVYVLITGQRKWFKGFRRNFILKNLKATDETTVSVVGQNDLVVEYWPENIPESKFVQNKDVLEISIARAQRIYNDKVWPNAVVVKLTNVEIIK